MIHDWKLTEIIGCFIFLLNIDKPAAIQFYKYVVDTVENNNAKGKNND